MVATEALTSLGTTSPRYIRQHAMYLPWRGSHFTYIDAGSNTDMVISATERLMVRLLCRDDGGIARKHEVDSRVWHK